MTPDLPWRTRLMGAGIAVVLVIAGVALLIAIRGQAADGGVTAKEAVQPRATASPSPSGHASPSKSPTPSPSTAPTPRPPAGPKPIARPALTVLNNSTVEGLGAQSAARFRAAGWTIADVGGLRGRYKNNTVYYEAGQLDAARLLMRQFPAITVIEPRSSVPSLPGSGLTVVVTRDFR